MQTGTHAPSGRRRITPAQLDAEMAYPAVACPVAITPGQALAAFKRAEPALGAPFQVVKLIDYLVGRTVAVDWDGRGRLGPIAWPSDAELEDRLGIGRSRCKQVVQAALELGFLRMRRSPTGKRYGGRDRDGRIAYAYGFDLSPLAERKTEFERLALEWEARRDEAKRLRREIACLRGEVLALTELASTQSYENGDWPAFAEQANALMRARGNHRDPFPLLPLQARLKALRLEVRERVEAAARCVVDVDQAVLDDVAAGLVLVQLGAVPVKCGESGPAGPIYRPHTTTTNQPIIVQTIARKGGQEGRNERQGHVVGVSAGAKAIEKAADRGPLRGFVVTPGFILAIAPVFAAYASGARPSWQDLARAGFDVRASLGISQHAWGQAVILLGEIEAVVVLATIAARYARGLVRSPGGLLRRMVELHEEGGLRLDRTLFGLAAELEKQRSGTPPH